jgi:hypothetical protein
MLQCIESLLEPQQSAGFRGVQSKSLVDIIQLECLSQSSSVLKITNSTNQLLEAKLWIQDGDIIDAQVGDTTGTDAFQKILAWRTGHFEILPPEPDHTRRITGSYQGLLLETAQALDETKTETPEAPSNVPPSRLSALGEFKGVEFLLEFSTEGKSPIASWGLEEPDRAAKWAGDLVRRFQALGESLQAGTLGGMEGSGPTRQFAMAIRPGNNLCAGFHRSVSHDLARETMKKILLKWAC